MNQYFRHIPFTESVHNDKTKFMTSFIPNRLLFVCGRSVIQNEEYEDVIFIVHFPFFVEKVDGYNASLVMTLSMNFPIISTSLTKNHFFFETLYDSLNLLIYRFYVLHFSSQNALNYLTESIANLVDSLEKTFLTLSFPKPELVNIEQFIAKSPKSKQFKDNTAFIASAISAHVQTYTTICLTSSGLCASAFMHLFEPFDTPVFAGHFYPIMFYPIVLETPSSLFSVVFTPELTPEQYVYFPFPFCVIDPAQRTVQICNKLSLPMHFDQRAVEITRWMFSTLRLDVSLRRIRQAFAPEGSYDSIIRSSKLSTYLQQRLVGFFKLDLHRQKMVLLKLSEELGMRGDIFVKSVEYGDVDLDVNLEWIRSFQEVYGCDMEGFILVLSSLKLMHPVLISTTLWMIQKNFDDIRVNFS
ncbi:hypothetical protein EIN_408590 [Entamoeba invadens IP1]|uniref:Uncharacterized protein n=1 Tax=Entamoeba invadens IP1 TaxID=370355 RepID=A0A0A1TZI8_ENTIV|nr:hypothetical protein EIN_408590 [Entamoeba invadens IP1]ELP85590.1 hypothetical protein EIN_408590 [Entamoeba invadens IP1]|eukprot:XP_004184936.1 hypothetical protein EIN_408590 [Entamoeba invadens IP1]